MVVMGRNRIGMAQRYTYAACLTWGGDIQTGEAEVECSYTVSWGRPATGPTYDSGGDPADPDEIDGVRILTVDGKPWPVDMSYGYQTPAQDHEMLVDKLLSDHYDEMLSEAVETDADQQSYAREMERDWP